MNTNAKKLANDIKAFKTKDFGPCYWYVLFTMILGAYPNKIDTQNKEHKKIQKYFKHTFYGLRYTLPCSICRNSYYKFYKENDISNYMSSKLKLCYWLYLLKDKVNKKLLAQEKEIEKNGAKLPFKTKESPSFEEVIKCYYLKRANSCNNEIKKCI